MKFILKPGQLAYADLRILLDETTQLSLDSSCENNIHASEKIVSDILSDGKTVYGINTGFGSLADKKINSHELTLLQRKLVLSHAAGTGELFTDSAVRLILALKINSLARGFSGVRLKTIEALCKLFNAKVYPCIPSQGSVGASGDLAPLAHLSLILLGEGEARHLGKIISAEQGLRLAGIEKIELAAKEGLALLNGTQVSTALALLALLSTEELITSALIAGSLTVDATLGSDTPFDRRIHDVRGQPQQIFIASLLRKLLHESEIRHSHRVNCEKVQDPYSIRCQPQVMGACLSHWLFAHNTLMIEANAVSDNPLVFAEDHEILSGGNFHAEPVAMAADTLALCIAEVGALSERRIALLTDNRFSGLPAFLVANPGINSGFMSAQITAASLASENKSLAHPASVDSLPTSANQEDHVSMATFAARRLFPMVENTAGIIAIELLAAAQGIDFRRPLKTSALLEIAHGLIRKYVTFYQEDRFFAPDIAVIKKLVLSNVFMDLFRFDLTNKTAL